MKLPYVDVNSIKNENTKQVIERIQQRRAPQPLLELDLTLLHSPAVADGWNSFYDAIAKHTRLSQKLKELVICRVAVLNGALYEWDIHYPLAVKAGLSGTIMTLVLRGKSNDWDVFGVGTDDEDEECVKAVIDYTDEMTLNIRVRPPVFNALTEFLNHEEIVELTATIAGYNCVSRFLVALDVGEKNRAAKIWSNALDER